MKEKIRDWWTINPEEEAKSSDSVHQPLPYEKRRKALPLLILGFTWGFLITGLLIGGAIGPGMPFFTGTIPSILIGCSILFVIATLTGLVGYKIGGTNDMVFQFAYGKKGRLLPGVFLFIVLMGFQGIIVGGVTTFWLKGTAHPAFFWVALLFGMLFTYTCYVGIKMIEKISNPTMVLLIAISIIAIVYNINQAGGWISFNSMTMGSFTGGEQIPLATGINLVIGSWIAGAVLTSDFTRFAKSKWVAVGMLFICFFVTQFLLIAMGAIGAVISGSYDMTQYLAGVSPVLGMIALIAMTLAMWTSSNTNLYLPAAQLASVSKRPFKVAVLACGFIGTMMGALGIFQQFESFIGFIASIIPPLVGPIVADYWIVHRTKYEVEYYHQLPEVNIPSIGAAMVGSGITFMATGIPLWNVPPVPFLTASWIVPSVLGIMVSISAYLVLFYAFKAAGFNSGYAKAIEQNAYISQPAIEEGKNVIKI